MASFSPNLAPYTDATLGWDLDSYDTLKGVFEQCMPNWSPPARSYTTGVLANEKSTLVRMTDTPELFGGELRIVAAIDFADGKIVRWVDYWDSSSFDGALYAQLRTPADSFPRDLKDGQVATRQRPSSSRRRRRSKARSGPAMPRRQAISCTPTSSSRTCRCARR
ncbi:MAG: hypothetical protein ACRDKX_07300 [Solirubrobacterales bacterium]